MAIFSRKNILNLFFILEILFLVIFILSILVFTVFNFNFTKINFLAKQTFWFNYDLKVNAIELSFIGIGCLSLSSLLLFYFSRKSYLHSAQPEFFFLGIFAFSFLAEVMRILYLSLLLYFPQLPGAIIFTKLIYLIRLFGIQALFLVTIYLLGFQYQKFEILVLIITISSIIIAAISPVDENILLATGLLKLNDEWAWAILNFSLILLSIFNLILSLKKRGNLFFMTGILFGLVSKELISFVLSPVTLIIAIFLLAFALIILYQEFKNHFTIT